MLNADQYWTNLGAAAAALVAAELPMAMSVREWEDTAMDALEAAGVMRRVSSESIKHDAVTAKTGRLPPLSPRERLAEFVRLVPITACRGVVAAPDALRVRPRTRLSRHPAVAVPAATGPPGQGSPATPM